MREKFKYAGQTVKTKQGVGISSFGQDMSVQDFAIEGWWENVGGCSWMSATGNPAALEYAIRHTECGANNNVPLLGNDVVYGKIGLFGHIFHVNELEIEL